MATPAVLYIDDRNPLISYMPNSSWARGGNASDYDGTSTLTGTAGASASITFSGTGISVFGTIERFSPGIPQFVLSSYSVDGGPTATYNATVQTQFQFQQNYFQSGPLASGSHTLVATQLTNNARFFIDYFLIIPPNSSITLAPTSTLPTSATSSSTSGAASSAGDGAKTPTAAIIGGTLGGLALIGIAVLVFWLIRKRAKNNHQRPPPSFPDQPFNSASATEQYQSPGGTYNVSSPAGAVSQFSYPTSSTPSQGIIPPLKLGAVHDTRYLPVRSFPPDNSSNSDTFPEPPRYEQ